MAEIKGGAAPSEVNRGAVQLSDLLEQRQFQIVIAHFKGRGRFYWECRQCGKWDCQTCGSSGSFGWAASINDAANDAKRHIPNCPTVIAAANRLIDDVMTVPEYRRLDLFVYGVGFLTMWGCTSCGKLSLDQDEHTLRHLDAADKARNGQEDRRG
jgi:hypothetical protein